MSRLKSIFLLLVSLGTLGSLLITDPAHAQPPLPSSFYGRVILDGKDIAAGTTVVAYVKGVAVARKPSQIYQGHSVYAINVPGDDPTTSTVEGGVQGDTVSFAVQERYGAKEVGTWSLGTNVELNLNASTSGTPVSLGTGVAPGPATPTVVALPFASPTAAATSGGGIPGVVWVLLVLAVILGVGVWAWVRLGRAA